tara:strand:- start:130 stop:369 length:240 start_codon:yes stop_codon:yes gene_type:complete
MKKIYIKERTREEEEELNKKIFHSHLVKLQELENLLKDLDLSDLILIRNLAENKISSYDKKVIKWLEKSLEATGSLNNE